MSSRELFSVEDGKVSRKKLTGKIVLEGNCPHCKKYLIMTEEEVLQASDNCPHCGAGFGVALTLINEVRHLRREISQSKEQKFQEKEQRIREREEQALAKEQERQARADAEERLRQERAYVEERNNKAAAAQEARRRRNDAESERQMNANRLGVMADHAKIDGAEASNERFPNVPKALGMLETIAVFEAVLGGIVVFVMLLFSLKLLSSESPLEGVVSFLGTAVLAFAVWVTYVLTMAAVEMYKMFVSIEDSSRKNNALLAMQIDLMLARNDQQDSDE